MDYKEEYKKWINSNYIDDETKEELKSINDEKEIEDRFYMDLEFGTAGLRGIIGAGTNRMNKYTVLKATQGLANFILKKNGQDRGVAISYDSRIMSKEFSEIAANCLNANGIKTFVFYRVSPVPELSFAVRQLKCIAGIMITASHNPPQYNGYKVMWEEGSQIIYPNDKLIIEEVNNIKNYEKAKTMDKEEAIKKGLYNVVGEEIDDLYIAELKKMVLNPDCIKIQSDLKIVYTPLHGSGNNMVQRILKEIGFKNVYVVPEQEHPNGNFPTVKYPNPEDEGAFKLAIELAKKVDAEIVLANDPDADRLGIYAKDINTGKYVKFTGNMSGALIAEYILSQKKKKGLLSENGAVVSTIVTTNLIKNISRKYKLKHFEVLTGFKYFGEKMKQFDETGLYKYEFGMEESYGCLPGTHARDKDGVAAVMILSEAAAYYKIHGLTLCDQMNVIYEKYGYYLEDTQSVSLNGVNGLKRMNEIMNYLRNNPFKQIGGYKVIKFRDYKAEYTINYITGETGKTDLPNSNVLYYELENDAWCCIRPSGTEPKIRYYVGVKGKNKEEALQKIEEVEKELIIKK